jgi:hypothetical protein
MPTFIKPGFWEKTKKGYANWLNLDQLIASLVPAPTNTYKSYVAVLTQTGTNAPTASVKINEIGTITYAYEGVGEYYINSSALFTNNKTVIFVGPGRFTTGVAILGSTVGSDSIVIVYSRNTSNVGTNGLILEVPIEIRVYN